MDKFGIDISRWQKGFNFDKAVSEGVEFAILRGAYHTDKDACFEEFYAACKKRNIPVGVYLYSMAKTVAEAKVEAEFLIANVLKDKQFEYPIYLDVEDKVQKALDKKLLTDIIVAFCEVIESAGYYVGIYSTARFLASHTDEKRLAVYDKWIAQWNTKCDYAGDFGLWQFGGETNYIRSNKIAGVVCDQDYAYKDYPTIIKKAGLNGYGKVEATVKVTVKEWQKAAIADGFKFPEYGADGKWGAECVSVATKAIVKKRLIYTYENLTEIVQTALGFTGSDVDGKCGKNTDAAIREYQRKNGLTVDGKVGLNTWRKILGVE